MTRTSRPFRINDGVGGIVGRAQQYMRQSSGERNVAVERWLRERATLHGIKGGPTPEAEEIIIPEPGLLWLPSEPAPRYGWSDSQPLPFPGANFWQPSGGTDLTPGMRVDYRNIGGAASGQYVVTGSGTGGAPIEGTPYFSFSSGISAGDSWASPSQEFRDYIANEGVTSPQFAWFCAVRLFGRPGSSNNTYFSSVLGTRRTSNPTGGYLLTMRSPANTMYWNLQCQWRGQDGVNYNLLGNIDQPIMSGAGSNAVWAVIGVMFETDRMLISMSQDYFDSAFFTLDADSQIRHRTDTNVQRFNFFQDGSNSGANTSNLAEAQYFDRQLTPQEFNIVMADMLVRLGINPN